MSTVSNETQGHANLSIPENIPFQFDETTYFPIPEHAQLSELSAKMISTIFDMGTPTALINDLKKEISTLISTREATAKRVSSSFDSIQAEYTQKLEARHCQYNIDMGRLQTDLEYFRSLATEAPKLQTENRQLKNRISQLSEELQTIRGEIPRNQAGTSSANAEDVILRSQLRESNWNHIDKDDQINSLKAEIKKLHCDCSDELRRAWSNTSDESLSKDKRIENLTRCIQSLQDTIMQNLTIQGRRSWSMGRNYIRIVGERNALKTQLDLIRAAGSASPEGTVPQPRTRLREQPQAGYEADNEDQVDGGDGMEIEPSRTTSVIVQREE